MTGTGLELAGAGEWSWRSEKSLATSCTIATRLAEAALHLAWWLLSLRLMAMALLLSTKGAITIFSLFSDWLICFLSATSSEFSDSLASAISSRLLSLAARVVLSTITWDCLLRTPSSHVAMAACKHTTLIII